MMALSQGRTIVNQGMSHYCNVHRVFVDSNHLKNCNLINVAGDSTRFSKQIRENRLIDMKSKLQIEIISNMVWIDQRIKQLEGHGYYKPVKRMFKTVYVKKAVMEYDEEKLLNNSAK
ncbi:hypothetical protein OXYTRIMIC_036 [Oxytricha trifallax]|uniref:Uncharacterized protein n=1 Tax=Oxytricha trifallax TaxID=1172189 RepID=A0A073HZE2_9SPIT|nr:hypothetical protein OXYTRIMIC_036 [Oxytricha trifallax]